MYPGTPPILVSDNSPTHIIGMTNALTMPNKTVVMSLCCRKYDVVVVVRNE